jgi:hypothetical protein
MYIIIYSLKSSNLFFSCLRARALVQMIDNAL